MMPDHNQWGHGWPLRLFEQGQRGELSASMQSWLMELRDGGARLRAGRGQTPYRAHMAGWTCYADPEEPWRFAYAEAITEAGLLALARTERRIEAEASQ